MEATEKKKQLLYLAWRYPDLLEATSLDQIKSETAQVLRGVLTAEDLRAINAFTDEELDEIDREITEPFRDIRQYGM